jgi:DNA-binding SARP family transcriptional activator/uncharacterized protein HemY
MEFRVLGAIGVWNGQRLLDIGGPGQRSLLALLLLQHNQTVTCSQLIDWVWGSDPPKTATNILQGRVSRLRRILGSHAAERDATSPLLTKPSGYLLEVVPGELDADRFERLVAEGRQAFAAGRAERAAADLRDALALWRGPALADVPSTVLVDSEAVRLEESRLAALEARIEADLACGRHRELVGELESFVGRHPLREVLYGQLMRALYRSGRQADALRVYRRARQVLIEGLGIEPGAELQRLERAVLSKDPSLEPAPAVDAGARRHSAVPVPCQLPADVRDFTGREETVAALLRLLEQDGSRHASALVVGCITGPAGVGKTALAVHVAHQLRPSFPDGQLHVNLRGAEAQALDPAEVLAGFLRALGLEGVVIADSLEERVRQYRSRLADRRVLVVLDNAASEAQVRPLLPGGGGCAALVTSRARLGGLEAAHPLALEVLEPDQAVALLGKVAGPARVTAEPEAAQAIVLLCGLLPLAVRIAGARLAGRPAWRLALLAERLGDERRRLDELATGDLAVRASVALSYHGCSAAERQLFCLLGMLAAPSVPAWVAASLLDTDVAAAEGLLERLVDAQLVEADGQDQAGQLRYRLHDLLRVYARERLQAEEPAPAKQASLRRVLQAALALAERADALLVPSGLYRYSGDPTFRPATDHPTAAVVERDPAAWLEAERANLVAAVEQACQAGLWEPSWRLADALAGFFQLHSHWNDWQQTHTLALAAARQAGDRNAEARVQVGLADLYLERNHSDDARRCLHQSLAAFRETDDRRGELQSLLNLGGIDTNQGRFDDAIPRLQESLAGFQELGLHSWEALALFYLGDVHRQQGRLDAAIACLSRSLTLVRAVADRSWEAAILRRLGLVDSARGRFQAAVAYLQRSLMLVRAVGERPGEAYVLQTLGELYRRQGRFDAAVGCLRQSLALVHSISDCGVEAWTLHSLGNLHREQGRLQDAAGCLEASLAAFRDLGYRHWEARALDSLGLLLAAKGDRAAACSVWRIALRTFRELHMPEGEEVAARLDGV